MSTIVHPLHLWMDQQMPLLLWRYTTDFKVIIYRIDLLKDYLLIYILILILSCAGAVSNNNNNKNIRNFNTTNYSERNFTTNVDVVKNLYTIPIAKKSHRKTTYSRRFMGNVNKIKYNNVNNENIIDDNFVKNNFREKQYLARKTYSDTGDVEYTSSWAVKLNDGYHEMTSSNDIIEGLINELGLLSHGSIGHLRGHFLLVHPTFYNHTPVPDSNLVLLRKRITERLKKHPLISWVQHEEVRNRKKRSLEFKDQFFPSQWHLDNLKFIGHDINITGVWENNITGKGVTVSVIDDGVEWTNPDILDNYSSKGSWDLNSNDGDPMPRVDEAGLNHHGTRCAGEIAAVANEYCAVGVAFGAKVSGIRILDGPMTDSLEAMAFNTKSNINDIYSCSWGPDDNGRTVDGPHQLAQAALARGVMAGRHGYGSIFVVASGNGGHFHDNCNFDGYANSIFTVTIGAVDELGQMPYYAEQCAAMLAVTYSSGQGHQRNIVTTDWRLGTGTGCTDRHTGTSAAAPLAAGVIALMLEARSCLTWRDIQHLIVYTSVRVDIDPEEWQVNMAGFAHSHKHGFGLLDSWRLVTSSKIWPNVPFMTSWSSPTMKVYHKIPLSRSRNLTERLYVTERMVENVVSLEHVTVTVNIKHPSRGQLAISLVSPYGTISRLASTRKYDKSTEGFTDWTFSTVRCWGERPVGQWRLLLRDRGDHLEDGVLKSWRLTFYGSSMTYEDTLERKRLVQKAISGRYLQHAGPPCPPPQTKVPKQDLISPRVLKVVLLLSGFFFLVAIYFILETLCMNEEKIATVQKDLEATFEIQTPDGVDIEAFLPKTLAKDDEQRLSNLIENGGSRPNSFSSFSFLDDDSLDDMKEAAETPDEDKRVQEFEERLKFALEQSLLLQMKQMNQIGCLEQDLKSLIGNEGLGIIDVFTSVPKKKKKKLKGILKKPKQYTE